MIKELRDKCRQLLQDGTVQVVIGYGQVATGNRVFPIFVDKPEDADNLVWNEHCYANLTTYLTRDDVQTYGKAAICVKGCDARAITVLEKESQIDRSQLVVIGLACNGLGNPRLPKCESCDIHEPNNADIVIGKAFENGKPAAGNSRYAALEEFMRKLPSNGWNTGPKN